MLTTLVNLNNSTMTYPPFGIYIYIGDSRLYFGYINLGGYSVGYRRRRVQRLT